MANAFKRVANYLGLVDDEEDLQPIVEPAPTVRTSRTVRPIPSESPAAPSWAASTVKLTPAQPAPVASVPVQQELPVMDQIFTIHPRFYNEARTVGEKYRSGQPVLMNLSDMDETERKKM